MGTRPNSSVIERREQIIHLIQEQGRITVDEISERFSVSRVIARHDLDSLSTQGKAQRIRGGALSILHAPPEPPVLQRLQQQMGEKQRIGQAAAGLVCEGDIIFLSSGSTVVEVSKALHNFQNLTVVTNSLPVMNTLADADGITLVLLGGILRKSELSVAGYITENNLNELRFNKVIMGFRAIDCKHGLTNDYLGDMTTDRAILNCGDEIIAVADHTKCGRVSAAFLAPITALHTLVTDEGISPEFALDIKALNIKLVTA